MRRSRQVALIATALILCTGCGDRSDEQIVSTQAPTLIREVRVLPELVEPTTTTTTTTIPPTTTTTQTPTTTVPPPPPTPVVTEVTTPPPACWGQQAAVQARWPAEQWGSACSIIGCESAGNPTADNPHSSASGIWQVLDGTWGGYGGYARALYAPTSVQHDFAYQLWLSSGWSPWSCY